MNTGGGGVGGGSQRKSSSGRLERPPESQWNVQVVKVKTRCFWNACKALSFGLVLMLIGTTMATLGYYADQLSVGQEMRGNTTVRIKHETRGFHLNNLSYAGPIVMGVGGFIVVAACVMTFEARDSAAKVVPARNKYGGAVGRVGSGAAPFQASRAHSSVRSGGSGQQQAAAAVAAALRAGSPCPSETRRALTAQFVQFSRALQHGSVGGPGSTPISKSPSAPNLAENSPNLSVGRPDRVSPRSVSKRSRTSLHPMTSGFHHTPGGCALLSPHALLYRQALSVDNPDYAGYFSPPRMSREPSGKESHESVVMEVSESGAAAAVPNQGAQRGSQASMVMDLHVDCPVTLRVKDKTRRSDTAKRHVFTRQNQVEDEETGAHYWERRETHSCSPRLPGYHPARGYEDILQTRSTPHSRRESVAGASRRGSVAETAGSGDCLVRAASLRRPRRLSTESRRRLSMYSRSGSDRSAGTLPPTPHDPPEPSGHLLTVPCPENIVIEEQGPEQS